MFWLALVVESPYESTEEFLFVEGIPVNIVKMAFDKIFWDINEWDNEFHSSSIIFSNFSSAG